MVENRPNRPINITNFPGNQGDNSPPKSPGLPQGVDSGIAPASMLSYPSAKDSEIFVQGLSEENRMFATQLIAGFDGLFKHPAYALGTSPRKRLETYVVKIHQMMNLMGEVNEALGHVDRHDISVSDKSVSEEQLVRAMGLKVGIGLYGLSLTREQVDLARKNGAEDSAEKFAGPLREFTLSVVTRPHMGLSLAELADQKKITEDGKLIDVYDLLTDTSQYSELPQGADDNFQAGSFQQSYALLYAFAPDDIFEHNPPKSQIEKEALKHARQFAKGVKDLRGEISTALFDVAHPMHEALSARIVADLQDSRRREVTLLLLVNSVRSFYRRSQNLASDPNNQEVGQVLMQATLKMLEDMHDLDPIHRVDDLEAIVEKNYDDQQPKNFEALKKKANEVFQRSSRLEYSLEGSEITFDGIIPPRNVLVFFEKGKPTQIGIELQYDNEYGEELEVDVYVDAKLGEFDWSLLEDPKWYPQKQQMFMNYMYAVMTQVEKEATELQRSKHRYTEPSHAITPAKTRLRRKSPQPKRGPYEGSMKKTSDVLQFIDPGRTSEAKPAVTLNFVFPEDPEKKLKKLSPDDRAIALSRLSRMSEGGVGKIKILSHSGKARKTAGGNLLGKVEMSGKNGGTKGIRLLVEQESCGNGQETWIVRDGDYRANVYKGNSLGKM